MNEGAPIIIKKKKAHGHGHHGGAWKVAYADFVTAMMAFFLVMWIMGMSDDERGAIQGYFNDPMGYTKSTPKGRPNLGYSGVRHRSAVKHMSSQALLDVEKDRRQLDQVKEDVEQFIKGQAGKGSGGAALSQLLKHVELRLTDEGLEIDLIEGKGVAYFQLGSSDVTNNARKVIGEIAPLLGKSGRVFFVDGHTDGRTYSGGAYDNFDLSADRAQAVKRALITSGVPKMQVLGVRAFADTRLRIPSNPFSDENRRVTLVMPFRKAETTAELRVDVADDLKDGGSRLREQTFVPRAPSIRD